MGKKRTPRIVSAAAEKIDTSKPVGNFDKSDLDDEDVTEQDPEKQLEHPSTFLDDPQEFIDAMVQEAAKQGMNSHNIEVAKDVLSVALGIAENVATGGIAGGIKAVAGAVAGASK